MKPLIIALDVDTDKEAVSLVKQTKAHCDLYKIGPSLILKYGPKIINRITRFKKKIFLDLKFHDIPNTMLRSVLQAYDNGVHCVTVHTSAGAAALRGLSQVKRRPLVWGVTVLTSLQHQDLIDLGFQHSPSGQVEHLALLARKCHLDGVVASVGETALLRNLLGRQFTIVTPGIRLAGDDVGDQKRIATPGHAKEAGSTFIVVGRPILEAKDPKNAAMLILKDWNR